MTKTVTEADFLRKFNGYKILTHPIRPPSYSIDIGKSTSVWRGGIGFKTYFSDFEKSSGLFIHMGKTEYHGSEGVNVTGKLLDDIPDPYNIQPHEIGLLKLKYGLTPEDIQLPELLRGEF